MDLSLDFFTKIAQIILWVSAGISIIQSALTVDAQKKTQHKVNATLCAVLASL
jgi:hypothetical protein